MPKLKILVQSYDFPPKLGGVASCAAGLCEALQAIPQTEVLVVAPEEAGDQVFDQQAPYSVVRTKLSAKSEVAALQLSLNFSKAVDHFNPDVILNLLWLPCGAAAYLGTRMGRHKKIPYFVYAHGVELLESRSTVRKKIRGLIAPLKRSVFRHSSGAFAVSHFTAKLLEEHCKINRSRIQVVFNAVDENRFSPRAKNGDLVGRFGLSGKFTFVTVTRLVDYKGIDYALRALALVVKERQDVRYLVVGEGEDRTRLVELTSRLGLGPYVEFAGRVSPDLLVDYLNLADVFMMLSRDDWKTPNNEGFGIVFLEASACEKPVLAGLSGGVSDAVLDGKTGVLVSPEDPEQIAKAMLGLMSDPLLRKKLGQEGRRRVEREFTWPLIATKVREELAHHVRN